MLNAVFSEIRGVCQHLLQAYDRLNSPYKSKQEKARFIDSVDEDVQHFLIKSLKKLYPDHVFVAEEKSAESQMDLPDHPHVWVIDPIDGSHNYMHHIPYFTISLCYYYNGEATVGLVYDLIHDELYTAVKGQGALLNQRRIQVSHVNSLEQAMCGIETKTGQDLPILSTCYSIRKLGCSSLTLCYVASGRFDLGICQSPHIWDYAAGLLIAKEAGAMVYNQAVETYQPGDPYLYVSNKKIRDKIECL